VVWTVPLPGPTWSSPVVVDGVLLEGDCRGVLHAYDVRDQRRAPVELWSVALGGCIEATPAVWKGRIYIGTRGGAMYALGEFRLFRSRRQVVFQAVLSAVGPGFVTGALGRWAVPGPDPMPAWLTIFIGLTGSLV